MSCKIISRSRLYITYRTESVGATIVQAFYELYGSDLEYLIFDEILNVERWESFVSRLRTSKKIIVTGSNAKLLSRELSTHLTGRHIDFELFPFNLREVFLLKDIRLKENWMYSIKEVSKVKRNIDDYLMLGGFPEVYKFGKRILQVIYADILEKDVITRYKIKNPQALKDLARYLISNSANEFSFTRLKNVVGLKDVHTVSNYVNYLENAYLIFKIERFSFKLKQQMIAPKKVYSIDTGLINAISFKASKNSGRLIENLVAIELLRRKSYQDSDLEIYYWKDHRQHEVDFIVKRDNKIKQLIQVCYDIEDYNTRQRELKSLVKASRELKCSNLLVITWDYEAEEEFKGKGKGEEIKFVPLWKWLLE